MELIRKLTREKHGKHMISMGLFLCPVCEKKVKKRLSNGKITKSCGCLEWKRGRGRKKTFGLSDADIKQLRIFYKSGRYTIQRLAAMKGISVEDAEYLLDEQAFGETLPLHIRLYKYFSELSS